MIVREPEPAPPTAWVRKGECNHCGWCCQFLGRRSLFQAFNLVGADGQPDHLRMQFKGNSDDYDRRYLELRGVKITDERKRVGHATIGIYLPCTAHDKDAGRCRVYEQRPRTCRDFPWAPEQVVGIPCSFWFERTVNGRSEVIAGDGAPQDDRTTRG